MKDKGKSVATLLLVILAAVGLAALSYFGIGQNHIMGIQNIKQGLDLKGGVSITYEADKASPSPKEMQTAQALIQERLDRRNYTEAEVAIEGGNRLRIDIPDIDDAEEAIAQIGQTARLYFLDEDGLELLTGDRVKDAYATTGNGQIVVALEFDDEGRRLFEEATANNIGKRILIALDDEVKSAPTVNERIVGGNAIITGSFTQAEAEELAALIRAGALPFNLNILSTNNIGAKLGANSLETSLLAGAIGFALVLVFMAGVYRVAGLAADLALVIYLGLMLVLLSLFRITLTLPGIAGIILSVGMAVDANVVIFERIKEELQTGRSARASIHAGFSRALPAIVDGNITTLIAAAILFWLGTGTIKGFAQTLALGIVISMFTAIVITRVLLKSFMSLGAVSPAVYGAAKVKNTERKNLKIVGNRYKFIALSAVVIGIGLGGMAINYSRGLGAFDYDVEFSGGSSLQIDLAQDFNNDDIIQIVADVTGQPSPQVQRVSGTNIVLIKIRSIDQETRIALVDSFKEKYNIPDDNVSFSDVSPTVSSEMRNTALLAVLAASAAMLIYVSVRFKDLRKGGSAIIALLHDALVMLAAYALLRIPLNYSFIAAILTILGYSINATIIMFDRVRENEKIMNRPSTELLVDASVTQTLTRSLYTSLTTLITVVCLYVLGVPSIKEFTLPIIIGIVAGAYSSICLSGSVWYLLMNRKKGA